MVITCIVAPLALSAILGFAFGAAASRAVTIGVSGASPALVRAAVQAAALPPGVTVRRLENRAQLRRDVADGRLSGGVVLSDPGTISLPHLLIPLVAPGASHSPGFDVVKRPDALVGQEWAESVAAGLASRLYADRLHPGSATERAALRVATRDLGNGGRAVLDYFAPSIAVIFLFIGSGRPLSIVGGKLLAILLTGLTSILVVWAVTAGVFGADWGDPGGVLLMCLGASLAMCGLGVMLTSLARNEREAFGVALIVGLFLSLLGGNLVPPGSLPQFLQVLSLGTPNGWALVGFGRLSLLGDPARAVLGPFLVLCAIAAVTGSVALTRLGRMVRP
jgi:hypothetical protein